MNATKHIFAFLLILAMADVSGQTREAIICFESEHLGNDRAEFSINGSKFTPDRKAHKIEIYKTEFDTLIGRWNGQQVGISILKFKENTEYIIKINPCSYYDIRPAKHPKLGVVRYDFISSGNDTALAVLDSYFQKVASEKESDYYSFVPSAMCVFGPKKIALTDITRNKEFGSVYFNFLHGEKLIFTYDERTQVQKLTLEGYIQEKDTYSNMDTID